VKKQYANSECEIRALFAIKNAEVCDTNRPEEQPGTCSQAKVYIDKPNMPNEI
jgi:hypothetical protein